MFSREETSRTKQEFWTAFGQYMRPIISADGRKINWINYHTGIRDVYFRMDAGKTTASIAISLEHTDEGIRELYFEQFLELRPLLHSTLGEEWTWQLHNRTDEGKVNSSIYIELPGHSILNRNHWPDLISFFKPRIIALDSFWEDARHSFEGLR